MSIFILFYDEDCIQVEPTYPEIFYPQIWLNTGSLGP